jgi:hypothetical protein
VRLAFQLSPSVTYFRKRILRGGQEVHLLPGGVDDLVERASIQVWGQVQNGQLVAAVVCINVFK